MPALPKSRTLTGSNQTFPLRFVDGESVFTMLQTEQQQEQQHEQSWRRWASQACPHTCPGLVV